jgi:hypothetical protein
MKAGGAGGIAAPAFLGVVRQQGTVPRTLAAFGRAERAAWGAVVKVTGAVLN